MNLKKVSKFSIWGGRREKFALICSLFCPVLQQPIPPHTLSILSSSVHKLNWFSRVSFLTCVWSQSFSKHVYATVSFLGWEALAVEIPFLKSLDCWYEQKPGCNQTYKSRCLQVTEGSKKKFCKKKGNSRIKDLISKYWVVFSVFRTIETVFKYNDSSVSFLSFFAF